MLNLELLKFDINKSDHHQLCNPNKSGQATIEFLLMISMILFLVIAHMFYSVAYVKIFIKDYQAFMVTRSAYLGTESLAEQLKHMTNATKTFKLPDPTLPKVADSAVYQLKFDIIIPKFTLKKSGLLNPTPVTIQVPYRSEVTADECRSTMNILGGYEDNGC